MQAERIALLTNVLNQVNDPISPLPLPLQQFTSSGQHQQPSPLGQQQHQQFGIGGQHQSQQLPPHLHRRASAPLNSHHQPSSPFVGYPQNYPLPPQYGGMGGSGPTTPAPVPTLNGSAAARARSQNDLRGLLRSEHQLQYQFDGALREEVQPPRMGLHHHRSATAIYQTASQTHNYPAQAQYSQNGFVGGGYGGYGAQRSPTGTSSTRSHGSQVPSPTSSSGHGFAFAEEEQNLGLNAAGGDTGITPSAPSLLPGFLQDMVKVQGSYSTNNNSNSHRVNNNGNSNGPRASHSIHSSPSTSTSESSWSLDEFDSPSSLAFDHPHYPHARHQIGGGAPSTSSYEHFTPAPFEHESSLSLFPSQVSLGPRGNGNGGLPSAPSTQQVQQQGPGVIGRPPRLSHNTSSVTSGNGVYVSRSNSSGSVASGGGALSIWQMDGEERQEEDEVKADELVSGTWKPASAIRSSSGNGVYNGGHRGLGGLEELAARLAISKREVGV